MSPVQTHVVVYFYETECNTEVEELGDSADFSYIFFLFTENRKLSLNNPTTSNILTITFEKATPTIHKNSLGCFANMLLGEKTTQAVRRTNSNRGDTRGSSPSYRESFFSVFFKCALEINTILL